MPNPLTREVESRMGLVFIGLMSLFLAGVLFFMIKQYDSDQIELGASVTQVKFISSTEHQLIAVWVRGNNIDIPEGRGYRYLIDKYPDRPWLKY